MRAPLRLFFLAALFVLASPLPAQTLDADEARTVSTTVRSLFETLREALTGMPDADFGDRLLPLAHSFGSIELNTAAPAPDDLSRQIQHLLDDVLRLRDDLRAEGQAVTAGRLDPVVSGLRDLLEAARQHDPNEPSPPASPRLDDEGDEDDWNEHQAHERDEDDHWRHERWRRYRTHYRSGVRIGEELFWGNGVLRQDLPVRYNRVEGLYVGLRRSPLELDAYRSARVFGEIGYAFSLEKARYSAGLDLRVTPRGPYAVKIGGAYRHGTASEDAWKADPIENALAAFFARHDFYDYYEAEGWTLYSETQLGRLGRVQLGYRNETHSPLANHATWSLFGGESFRLNPAADSGRAQSLVGTLELGRVRGFSSLPSGAAFRADVELGQGLGGDFDFTRLVADGRVYVPVSREASLSLRVRGGTAFGGDVPFQKGFTIGGVGTVRAYPQNVFFGTRMLLANAEIAVQQPAMLDDLLDDLQLFGFADAGWVNGASDALHTDDAIASAGFGVGLDNRQLRLELAWPLRDRGFGLQPSLWLRLAPTF